MRKAQVMCVQTLNMFFFIPDKTKTKLFILWILTPHIQTNDTESKAIIIIRVTYGIFYRTKKSSN